MHLLAFVAAGLCAPETRVSPPCFSSITGSSCCCTRPTISPSRHHKPTEPSAAPVTKRVAALLWMVCIAVTAPPCPTHAPLHDPLSASHTRAVQSSLPVRSRGVRPSPAAAEAARGRKLTCLTAPVCPLHSERGVLPCRGCKHTDKREREGPCNGISTSRASISTLNTYVFCPCKFLVLRGHHFLGADFQPHWQATCSHSTEAWSCWGEIHAVSCQQSHVPAACPK